jgi:hypothetical protein
MDCILQILAVVGVGSWEGLIGAACRIDVKADVIQGLGHIATGDTWFHPVKFWHDHYCIVDNSVARKSGASSASS